jgi:hypothetical protein
VISLQRLLFASTSKSILTAAFLALLVLAPDLAAQGRGRCENGRVARIAIESQPVFADSAGAMLSKLYAVANWLHIETRERVIRQELLFRTGDCFDPLRMSESERLLREFAFLQSASVEARQRWDGDWDVAVVTRDDWSLRLEPQFQFGGGFDVTGIGLAERNLWGTGRGIELQYVDRPGRDEVGAVYFDPRFFGTRWDLLLSGARTEPGWLLRGTIGYPFLGLVGRRAAFQDALYGERWFRYIVGDAESLSALILPYRQWALQLGGAVRLLAAPRGEATKLGTYGLILSYERLTYGNSFCEDGSGTNGCGFSGAEADALTSLTLRERESLRLNLVVGVRGLEFVQRSGLSTLRGEEDIALGMAADLVLGLAARAFGSRDRHVLAALDLYGGSRVWGDWFWLVRANVEVRRDYKARRWQDVFAAFQWTNYWRLSRRHSVLLTAQGGGGWRATIPFQLTLGAPWGLAGLAAHRYPGGARVVVRLEDRYLLATVGRLFDLGTALFVDGGRMWANETLYGVNSGIRGSVGASVRLAMPAGARMTYRLDVGAPIDARTDLGDVVVSFRIERVLRLERDPIDRQLGRSRDFALGSAAANLK